jgi:hypothetical protein
MRFEEVSCSHASIGRLSASMNLSRTYLPLTTSQMLKADMWAMARKVGQPTADPKELDCDVILAAQALSVNAIVATENIGHLARFVDARHWKDIGAEGSDSI